MPSARLAALGAAMWVLASAPEAEAEALRPHADVRGAEIFDASLRGADGTWRALQWDDLERTRLDPGRYQVRFRIDGSGGGALRIPQCAGRERVIVDDRDVAAPQGPVVFPLASGPHDVRIALLVSAYEGRVACGEHPRIGSMVQTVDGLGTVAFASPSSSKGGGQAVLYLPPGHDVHAPTALLVGLHPWNGTMWTYAAYAPLLREARARDVALLLPSGLGNSLYTAAAEDEVLRAVAAVSDTVAIDPRAVSIWGASMGGAGATTIGFHRPDQFASVTSFFGDSKYDLGTYVRSLLPSEAEAHLVNALDVVDNARELPVWLLHGDSDTTSPIRQSEILANALKDRGWRVRFDRVAGAGHSGALVARFLPEVVAIAATMRVPQRVERVTYRSVRPSDTQAYGVHVVRTAPGGDAFVDIERRGSVVHVLRATGLRTVVLSRTALGTASGDRLPIVIDGGPSDLDVHWEP